MAAVLLLVFLPGTFAVLFMLGTTVGHFTVLNVMGVALFVMLGVSLVVGMMRLSSQWDHPREHPP